MQFSLKGNTFEQSDTLQIRRVRFILEKTSVAVIVGAAKDDVFAVAVVQI